MTPVDATILDRARGAGRWYGQVAGPRSSRDRVRQDLLWRCKVCKVCKRRAGVGSLHRTGLCGYRYAGLDSKVPGKSSDVGSCQAHRYCFCRGAAYVVQAVGTQEAGLASVVYPDGAEQAMTLTDESP
jgi:hypothetical protein